MGKEPALVPGDLFNHDDQQMIVWIHGDLRLLAIQAVGAIEPLGFNIADVKPKVTGNNHSLLMERLRDYDALQRAIAGTSDRVNFVRQLKQKAVGASSASSEKPSLFGKGDGQ